MCNEHGKSVWIFMVSCTFTPSNLHFPRAVVVGTCDNMRSFSQTLHILISLGTSALRNLHFWYAGSLGISTGSNDYLFFLCFFVCFYRFLKLVSRYMCNEHGKSVWIFMVWCTFTPSNLHFPRAVEVGTCDNMRNSSQTLHIFISLGTSALRNLHFWYAESLGISIVSNDYLFFCFFCVFLWFSQTSI